MTTHNVQPTDGDAPITMQTGSSPFIRFWADLNATFATHGLPEILYGEAKDLWNRRVDAWEEMR